MPLPALPAVGERAAFKVTPCLVPSPGEKTRRKVRPAQAPTYGAAWPANAPRCQCPGMAPHELAVIAVKTTGKVVSFRQPKARRAAA